LISNLVILIWNKTKTSENNCSTHTIIRFFVVVDTYGMQRRVVLLYSRYGSWAWCWRQTSLLLADTAGIGTVCSVW